MGNWKACWFAVAIAVVACSESFVPAALVATVPEPAGANCATEGYAIATGRDLDDDGVLDPSEVTSTVYICQPPPPPLPPRQLVNVVPEPAGPHCAQGGQAVVVGIDSNLSGVLDADEVSSISYVCSGSPGAQALVAVVAAGASCPHGGQTIQVGSDINGNGVLDPSEVTSTSDVCGGADGSQALIRVDPEPSGSSCSAGGSAIHAGLDLDDDTILDDSEIQSTTYLCGPPPAATVIYGDVIIHNSLELAQLDGVATITGDLVVDLVVDSTYLPWVGVVRVPTLQQVGGELRCDQCGYQTAYSFPNLVSVGAIRLYFVESLDLPKLVTGSVSVSYASSSPTELTLASLEEGHVSVDGGFAPPIVSLPKLAVGSLDLTNIVSISVPRLTTAPINGWGVHITGTPVALLSLPSLTSGNIALRDAPNLAAISLPVLESGYVRVDELTALESLDLPEMRTGGFAAVHLPALTSISVPLLDSGYILLWDAPMVSELALPALTTTTSLILWQNASLSAVSAPVLAMTTTRFDIVDNPVFPTCKAHELAAQAHATTVSITGNDDLAICP